MASRAATRRWIAALAAVCGALWPVSGGADANPVVVTTTQTAVGVAVCQSGCLQVVNVENLSLVIIYVGAPPAPASIRVSPLAIDFGPVPSGGSAPIRAVRVLNTGPTPVVVSGSRLSGPNGADFGIRSTTCLPGAALAGILQPRTGCSVQVGFSPAASGRRDATLSVIVNQVPHSIRLTGRGARPGALAIAPAAVDFGSGTVGGSGMVRALRLRNAGEAPLRLLGLSIGGDYTQASDCLRGGSPTPLGPQTSCTVRVRFSPIAAGTRPGALTISSDAPGGPVVVPLTGNGVDPIAQLVPRAVRFGGVPVGESSPPQRIELDNTGTDPLSITGISVTSSQFKVTRDCPRSLPPGGLCTIAVVVTPLQPGALRADLVVGDNAAGSPQRVALTAIGLGVEVVGRTAAFTAAASPGKTATLAPQTATSAPHITLPITTPAAAPAVTASPPASPPPGKGASHPLARAPRHPAPSVASVQTPAPTAAPAEAALPNAQPVRRSANVVNARLAPQPTGSRTPAAAAPSGHASAAVWVLALILLTGAVTGIWWGRRVARARRCCGLLRR